MKLCPKLTTNVEQFQFVIEKLSHLRLQRRKNKQLQAQWENNLSNFWCRNGEKIKQLEAGWKKWSLLKPIVVFLPFIFQGWSTSSGWTFLLATPTLRQPWCSQRPAFTPMWTSMGTFAWTFWKRIGRPSTKSEPFFSPSSHCWPSPTQTAPSMSKPHSCGQIRRHTRKYCWKNTRRNRKRPSRSRYVWSQKWQISKILPLEWSLFSHVPENHGFLGRL